MLGVVNRTAGDVRLFGAPLGPSAPWDRIGYVPQRLPAAAGVPATAYEVVTSDSHDLTYLASWESGQYADTHRWYRSFTVDAAAAALLSVCSRCARSTSSIGSAVSSICTPFQYGVPSSHMFCAHCPSGFWVACK